MSFLMKKKKFYAFLPGQTVAVTKISIQFVGDIWPWHSGGMRMRDPVVQERAAAVEQGDTPTPAQECAFHKSTRGAIKTAEIAGAIFNHKNDKMGHHDVFRYWWWEHVGTPFTFPDTSNNQFQSYCDAAAALILHSDDFKAFLESLHINK